MRLLSFRTALLATGLFASGLAPLSASVLIGYWDLNGEPTHRTAGFSGNISFLMADIGTGGHMGSAPGQGSSVNLLSPDYSPGASFRFSEFAAFTVVGIVEFSQLDLSGLTSPTLSFALRKSDLFTFFSSFQVDYHNSTGWHTAATFSERPGTDYELYSVTFDPGLIDDTANARIRVYFHEVLTVAGHIDFDNFQIRASAIPEPGSMTLLGGAAVLLGGAALRRRRGAGHSSGRKSTARLSSK